MVRNCLSGRLKKGTGSSNAPSSPVVEHCCDVPVPFFNGLLSVTDEQHHRKAVSAEAKGRFSAGLASALVTVLACLLASADVDRWHKQYAWFAENGYWKLVAVFAAAGIFGGIVGLIYMFAGRAVGLAKDGPVCRHIGRRDGLTNSSGARRDVEDDPLRLHLVDGSRAIAVGR